MESKGRPFRLPPMPRPRLRSPARRPGLREPLPAAGRGRPPTEESHRTSDFSRRFGVYEKPFLIEDDVDVAGLIRTEHLGTGGRQFVEHFRNGMPIRIRLTDADDRQ